MERKILVAVEGTSPSQNTLQYLCKQFAGQPEISFQLLSFVPHQVSASGKELLDEQDLLTSVDTPTRKRLASHKHHMQSAFDELVACGFKEDQINTETRLSRASVAADLLFTAKSGLYDAIVVSKRDLSTLERAISGSISSELLSKKGQLPLWIVNGKIDSNKFLVPVDCTPHTLTAIDHLAFILKDNPHAEITLFHSCSLFSSEVITPKEEFYGQWGKEWCDEHLQGEEDGHFHFSASEQLLNEGGFPLERVQRLTTHKGIEPAQQIVYLIKKGSYGTIVMGRRGKDIHKGIFKGVSDRVLANVNNVAIWVIG